MIAAVCDNTVLSNFAHVQQPKLIATAFENPVTVAAVMEEWGVGVKLGRIPSADWSWLPVVELTTAETVTAQSLRLTLGYGEAQCIALAASRSWLVLTDDRNARRAAESLAVATSGTLGVLITLVRHEVLPLADGDRLLGRMVSAGYRSPVDSLSELINRL